MTRKGRVKRQAGVAIRKPRDPANAVRRADVKAARLEGIPGVGRSISQDLRDLGVRRVSDLRNRDPQEMYEGLCALRGSKQDCCVLYVFRCAVYYAKNSQHDPELLKWWNWKTVIPTE